MNGGPADPIMGKGVGNFAEPVSGGTGENAVYQKITISNPAVIRQ
jgi:hypothetical protein